MRGIEPTLDAWLELNEVSDVYDAELLEVIPAEFHDEYYDRLRLNSHYERKFAELYSYEPLENSNLAHTTHGACLASTEKQ